jgi:hypothetical protein
LVELKMDGSQLKVAALKVKFLSRRKIYTLYRLRKRIRKMMCWYERC